MADKVVGSPYRLLVPFGAEDWSVFFGRDREIKYLVADVVTNRIVVLFARTGTGKTSLLNAGVLPALEQKGFRTLYVRIGDDPMGELARRISNDLQIDNTREADAITTLVQHVKSGKESFVLVLDQFEEFFNNVLSKSPRHAEVFREGVAEAIADSNVPLHFVFSLREEYFGRMIFFRQSIPNIFDAGFSVELSGLGQPEAAEAIRRPAESRGVHFDEALVQRLIMELRGHSGVETAALQIVCDTLFRQRADPNSVTEADLERVTRGNLKLLVRQFAPTCTRRMRL